MEQALTLAKEAAALAGEASAALIGPWVHGCLALMAPDWETMASAIREGERLVAGRCVGHNQLWFFRHAAEARIRSGDWEEAEGYAERMERYTVAEPILWSGFFCALIRGLAQRGRSSGSRTLDRRLETLLVEARRLGFLLSARRIETALGGRD